MRGQVSGSRRVTGSAGGGTGRPFINIASSRVGGHRGGAGGATPDFASGPGPGRFEGLAGPVVGWPLGFEVLEDVLGAVGSPEHQCLVVGTNRLNPQVDLLNCDVGGWPQCEPRKGIAALCGHESSPVLVQSRIAPHGVPVLWNWGGSSLGPRYTSMPSSEPTR